MNAESMLQSRHEVPSPLLGRQRVRRGLTLALGLICVLLAEGPAVGALIGADWETVAGILAVLLMLGLNAVLRSATRRLAVAEDSALDERQERIRNYAYRLSHRVLVVAFGIPLWLLFFHAPSSGNPSWLQDAESNAGLIVVYLELLFFLPTAAIAWIEPDTPEDEEIEHRRFTWPQRLSWTALIIVILLPFALSLGLPFISSTTSTTHIVHFASGVGDRSLGTCRYVGATTSAGVIVQGSVQLGGEFCSNGKRIHRLWGLFGGCALGNSSLATISTHCTTTFDSSGTMHLRYLATVKASLLPVIQHRIAINLVVRRDGHIVRFP